MGGTQKTQVFWQAELSTSSWYTKLDISQAHHFKISNYVTYIFYKHSREESCIMVCNQTAGTVKPLALMNQHITSLVLKFICYY